MSYIPNATDTSEPRSTQKAGTAAEEFRTIKRRLADLFGALAGVTITGAAQWNSATTYAFGDPVWSPVDFKTYRRKIAGQTAIDPSADAVNWEPVDAPPPDLTPLESAIAALENSVNNPNLLVNPAFMLNLRNYVSGTVTTEANQETLIGWNVVVLGEDLVFAASAGYGNEINAPAGGLSQVVSGERIYGGDYCLYWEGTGTATVNGVARAKGESFALPAATDATVTLVGVVSEIQLLRAGSYNQFTAQPRKQQLQDALPYYACRAYCSFNAFAVNGTYSQSGTTITVTLSDHQQEVGDIADLNFTSGAAVDAQLEVTEIVSPTQFRVEAAAALTTSGNVTRNLNIKTLRNIASIVKNGAGDYTINFDLPFKDTNYAVMALGTLGAAASASVVIGFRDTGTVTSPQDDVIKTPTQVRLLSQTANSGTLRDPTRVDLAFFGD